ncbi:MAG TPA: DUF2911 domain-containing protein [Tepidisphaeraceae bacterium]|jgi:hypothetical protein|nr:DUF2911 domain-containing protein [Tepidisphaeraceae bacterium]
MKAAWTLLVVLISLMIVAPAMAQQKRVSPHETVGTVIDGDRVTVVYGRPYTKDPKSGTDRKIWGGLVPFGKIWRTGADEATLLITQKPIVMGDVTIPAGAYSLWTLPNEDGSAKLVINKQIGQWGVDRNIKNVYDEANDVGRVDLKKDALDKAVDQFTIGLGKGASGGGELKMSWETTGYSVPFTVQKTDGK